MIDDTGYNENEYDASGTDPMAPNGTEGMEGVDGNAYANGDGMEGMPTDALEHPTEEEQPAEKKKTPRPKGIGKYIFLALLFALLSLGGLVIGFLGSFLGFFRHPMVHGTSDIDATILGAFINSLSNFGDIFSSISEVFSISISAGIEVFIALLVNILPVVFAFVSLIMFIVAAATKKLERARTCAYASGILTFLAYGAFFLYTFAKLSVAVGIAEISLNDVIDYSCLIIAGVSFVTLFIATCVRSKKVGFLNALTLLLTIVCALCIYYPGTITSAFTGSAFDFVKGTLISEAMPFFGIAFPALIVILLLNLIISSARLNAQRGLMFDAVRYGLQLLALILTIIATICFPFFEDRWLLFKDTQLIATIILLVLTIACLFIPLFTLIYRAIKRRGEKQAAEQQFQGEAAQDPNYSNYDYNGYDNGYQGDYAQPTGEAQEQPQGDYAQPQPENNYQNYNPYQDSVAPTPDYNYQPQPQMQDSEPVVVTIDTEDLQNFFNMQPEPQPEPEPETLRYQAPEPEPEMLNTHEPVVIKEVIREVIKEKEPEPAPKELTDFERRMAALAKANDAPKEPEQQQERPTQQRPRPNPQQNGFRQGANQRPNPQQNNPFMRNRHNNEQGNNPNVPAFAGNRQPNSYVFGGSQYTYDPFINTLTPMEKNEFGDVFIANLYGIHSYLPTYIIGGDNTEFFQTIFIHLGRFRGNISHELMEKIYAYVNKSSS